MSVGQVRVVERLFGSRTQHQCLAVQALQLLNVLTQAFWRYAIEVDPHDRQGERFSSHSRCCHRMQQRVDRVEGVDAQAAIFQLMFQGLASQFMGVDDGHPTLHQ
ncbi:hypothetical protein D3C77_623270 [compost metagenome]